MIDGFVVAFETLFKWINAVLIAPTAYIITVYALMRMLGWTLASIDGPHEVNNDD